MAAIMNGISAYGGKKKNNRKKRHRRRKEKKKQLKKVTKSLSPEKESSLFNLLTLLSSSSQF
jgi:hypothetical protein